MEIKRYLPNKIYYRLQHGEDKRAVAEKFNTKLTNVTCLNSNYMSEGDFVVIKNAHQKVHIVKPLETLNEIAKSYGLDEETIINNNQLKTNVLFVGQRLLL